MPVGKRNFRPWGYESPSRRKRKYLPFQKLQPPRVLVRFTLNPIPTIPYTSCALCFGHKMATGFLRGEICCDA